MSVMSTLRLNMTGRCEDPEEESRRYQAALDMAGYVDEHGFDVVNLEEHHCADNGWLPAPIPMAGMVIARTRHVRVSITALLVTLYDPVRLAEDIAVLDLASGGRFTFVAGMGYRPVEYAATGRSFADRGRLMDEAIELMRKAWRGEPFERDGQMVRITPRPLTQPHPLFLVGGMSRPAVRRAARNGLPFCPAEHRPDLEAYYHEQLAEHGQQGFVVSMGGANSMWFIDENPDALWEELAPFLLREVQEYSGWKVDGVARPAEQPVRDLADLRRQKRFEILTPGEARERLNAKGAHAAVMHPLAGGVPLDRAWRSLELYVEQVLKPLRAG